MNIVEQLKQVQQVFKMLVIACKMEPAMNHQKYDSLGIEVNKAISLLPALIAQAEEVQQSEILENKSMSGIEAEIAIRMKIQGDMSDLERIAIEFCETVLGWKDCVSFTPFMARAHIESRNAQKCLDYTNLDAMLKIVKECFPKAKIVIETRPDRTYVSIYHEYGIDCSGESQTGEPITYCLMKAAIYSKNHIDTHSDVKTVESQEKQP